MKSIRFRVILFIGILAVGISATAYMMTHKITPERAPTEEEITPVSVHTLKRSTEQVKIEVYGTVIPSRQVRIQPEVSGRVTEMNEKLIPGGYLSEGAMLVRIDSRDYEAQVAARKDQVVQAGLRLKQEQARQAIAREEWELLGDTIPPDKANRELALRIPQIESAEAALNAAQSALFKAELDLERCTVLAPFNALVLHENVDPGQLVNSQTEIAVLAGTDRYWVRVSVPTEYLPWIEIPKEGGKGSVAKITQKTGLNNISRKGYVIRLLGDLDTNGRMARLLVSVDDPLNLKKDRDQISLLLGSYVTVEIAGKSMSDIMVVPRNAIRNLDGEAASRYQDYEGIWIMDRDDRLQIKPVEVVWRAQDSVFITTDMSDGIRLVTSSIPTPIRGMKLTIHSSEIGSANVLATEE